MHSSICISIKYIGAYKSLDISSSAELFVRPVQNGMMVVTILNARIPNVTNLFKCFFLGELSAGLELLVAEPAVGCAIEFILEMLVFQTGTQSRSFSFTQLLNSSG